LVAHHGHNPDCAVDIGRESGVPDPVARETLYQPACLSQTGRCWEARAARAFEAFVAHQQDTERKGVVVLVYNYAAVSAYTLSRARERVNRLYRETGVEIEWLDPVTTSKYWSNSTLNPSQTFTVQMMIRSRRAYQGSSTPESVMGTALQGDENGGTFSLFYDQVVQVAGKYNQPLADILGLAIAHEMGHLLLPVPGHSNTGIMRAEWGSDDIRRGLVGSLVFTSAQAALIRMKVDGCRLQGAK
jgi:hypothetical protein